MEKIISIKRYGIKKSWDGVRWAVITDVSKDGKTFHTASTTYAKKAFAIKKAQEFSESMYCNLVNFQGKQVIFEHMNIGEIDVRTIRGEPGYVQATSL